MAARRRDRRSGTDRTNEGALSGDGSRKIERRMGDRRDSPRIPIALMVRHPSAGDSFEEREGDVGLGGVYFEERSEPQGSGVELRFKLPTLQDEVRCEGEIIRVSQEGEGVFGVHVRFGELPTEIERAIARFIDDHELGRAKQEA